MFGKDESATRSQDSLNLTECCLQVGDGAQGPQCDEGVHRLVCKRQPLGIAPNAIEATEIAALALFIKEAVSLRRTELLTTTNNPVDMEIIGMEGRAEMLRESVRAAQFSVDRVIPSREQMLQRKKDAQARESLFFQSTLTRFKLRNPSALFMSLCMDWW